MTRTSQFALSLFASAALIATSAIAQDGGRKLQTRLTGAAEVSGGDPDGRGVATVTVNPGKRRICYALIVRNIEPATIAHIHVGVAGIAGPAVVTLRAPLGGRSSDCLRVSRDLASAILRNPARYYVNVHNGDYPDGAIRGQLAK